MSEVIFLVEADPDGGFTARGVGLDVFAEADDLEALRKAVRDAVRCHFPDASTRPRLIRLHHVHDDVIAV